MSQQASYQIKTSELVKVVASGWLGTAMEFMDFQLYSLAAAIVFNEIFFPESDPAMGLIMAMGTYGAGYVARLVGAFVFGHVGVGVVGGRTAREGLAARFERDAELLDLRLVEHREAVVRAGACPRCRAGCRSVSNSSQSGLRKLANTHSNDKLDKLNKTREKGVSHGTKR